MQRDVGGRDHVRDRRQHQPAGDRERRQRRDQRDQPGRRPRALVPGEAADEDQRRAARRPRPASSSAPPPPRSRRAPRAARRRPRSGVIAPSPPRIRATSVAKYQPPESISSAARRRSARRRRAAPPGRRTRAANSTSWVATSTAAPRAGELAEPARRARPCGPRSMPRVGSSRQTMPGALAGAAPGHHDRQREPLALAAGEVARVALGRPLEARRGQRRAPAVARQLLVDPLADEQVGRALRQQRAAGRASIRAADRLEQARPRRAAGALAGAVAAHQRDPLAGLDREVEPAQHLRGPSPGSSSTHRSRAAKRRRTVAAPPATRGARRSASRLGAGTLDPRAARRVRARLLDRRPAAAAGRRARTAARPGSRAPGSASSAHSPNPLRRAVEGDPRRRPARPPGRRRRGSARAGARRARTAIPHSSLSRRSRPISSSPATGSSCEVGSSSSTSRGRRTSAAAERDPLQLAARERVGGAVEQVRRSPSASATSSTARARAAAGSPRSSSGSSSSPRTVAETTWVSGSWPTRPTRPPSSAGPCSRTSRPQTSSEPRRPRRRGSAGPARSRRAAGSTCPTPSGRRGRTNSPAPSSRSSARSAGAAAPG